MDSSRKPEKLNPRRHANIFSQLLFAWAIPLLYKGSKQGLNTDDLTMCLPQDCSEDLGDRLENNWYNEVERAHRKGRKPLLRNAILRTFWLPAVVDGIISLIYIIIASLIPAVLAQLLIQFQKQNASTSILTPNGTTDTEDVIANATSRAAPSIESAAIKNTTSLLTLVTDIGVSAGSGGASSSTTDVIGKSTTNSFVIADNSSTPAAQPDLAASEDPFLFILSDVYWLSAILVISSFIGCFLIHHVDLRQRLMGARMRIACCSLIYRKTLNLSMRSAGQTPTGYLINLLSNDVNRLDYGFIFMHWIWILPLHAMLICYLIWLRSGWAAIVGVVSILLQTIPIHTALSKLSSKLRMKIAERTDARVGIMHELVQGIQVIKMYAWEKPFQAVVGEARRREIKQIRYASYLRGFYLSTMVFTQRSTLYITIATAVLMGNQVSADMVFSSASYYDILKIVAAIWYPLAVSLGAEALVSLKRVESFLLQEKHDEKVHGLTHRKGEPKGDERDASTAIVLKQVNANWDLAKPQLTLQNINLKIERGQLCAVIGPVGAGKSSLLQLLLSELPIIDGEVVIRGELSYAAQEPWLFASTVRNNILFGETYDRKRYQEVTRCCALTKDFQQLANGDKTNVGERGASLSGGQRARISLARAVYKPASIYLLDDPLGAVDAHVGRHLFDEVIGPRGRLASEKATRVLITHQVHFLTEADWIVILENGCISHQGTYEELSNSDLDFAKLLERIKEKECEDENESILSYDLSTYEVDDIPYIDGEGDGYQSLRRTSVNDGYLTRKSVSLAISSVADLSENLGGPEDQAKGGVSGRVWWEYFHAGSNLCGLILMTIFMLMSQVVCSGSDYFVNIWTQQEYLRSLSKPTTFTTFECLYIYGVLIIAVILMTIFRGYLFFKVCMHASKVLHDRMFGCILRATMRFFDTNPSGSILNRFSKDMGAIDEYLPKAIMDFIQVALAMFGILIVITLVNPILLVSTFIMAVVDYCVLRLYLRPSQDLKRLEGICRSPVFSHLSATLSGIATIRARELQDVVAKEFDSLQDVHSAVWQLTMSSNIALGLWFDLVSCCFLASVTFSFTLGDNRTFSGNVGLAISQATILTGMVQYGVRQVAESLQQMTSVERALQYTDLEQESEITKLPPSNWPTQGQVEFKDLSLRYDPSNPAVLKHLTITIGPSWKVGVVGRTGAGKSSLIGALFRLSHLEGDILVDGIETGSISLEALRSKISIIPQDPVLFSATIRYNLDPFDKYGDADLWRALEDVELKGVIPGLDYMVNQRGSNFSVGQRQLLCMARAILRNNKLLVLDEATANVDPQTDALIQSTIRTKFMHCTVLTVAHRLRTVIDSDRILVMDDGRVREFDIPHLLLKKEGGALRHIVDATGAEAELLKKIASETYHKMQRA
ncbi:PREDICTED: multidrug resistance-associated protein 4-like [Rhagoletis zephyria]|uniref:multidrug resistance-associated protein 4-like n=1 Tax=Rhagoletis zephyria TaxID=28612 RepID=UPI0008116EF6|nr:PREDICTED: multidrug resistance-associated protein 4-like [Rhagoletis zephyria]